MTYTSLHNHSMYSVLDGYATPKEYLERAKEIGLKGFCISEHGNQYSWVYFDEIKKNYPEVKMIYGVELYECFDIKIQDKDNKYFHLLAIARNEQGRIALNEIVTKSNFEGFYYKPRVDLDMLKKHAENLIICSACLASKLARENDYNKCIEYVNEYKYIFPYYYLEMQSHKNQKEYNQKILQLSKDTNTPFIITTDSHAATKEDLYYQARHVQIAHDDETLTESYEGCYLQSEKEIHEIMDDQIGKDNVDIGLNNTNKIADIIEIINMPFQEPQLPTFPLPKEFNDNNKYIKYLIEQNWDERYGYLSIEEQKIRKDRVKYELKVINQMNFDGYFLIVWDFIKYARENNIMVAPGRGSCAGSAVCYLLKITDLDPVKYGLIFERFLNPERVSMPDTDTDVSDREKVIKYLINKYGEQNVCQVINFSYITPIVAIKDVGRILNIPYQVCDKISKKFVYDTFEECIKNNSDLYEQYADYKDWFDVAGKLSGRIRQVSVHAGGVGIVDTKITDYIGMKISNKNEHVIQVDKNMIEKIGIIKFDILGVQTLNIIQNVINELKLDPYEISINNDKFEKDEKSFHLLSEARTNGVFQVESSGMKDLLFRLKPQNMEELCAVISLFRPDSMKALEDYIQFKHNPEKITYIHKDMESILNTTYGCMIYQEQLLDIVRKFGNRTYGGADKFRKAIGKKLPELVKQESVKLYSEILNTGYNEELAKTISDELAEKGGYMFNKPHGMSYAVVCKQTAYLKSHYPVYYFKALLNQNKDDYGALNKYIIDAKEHGIEILPPHINKSQRDFVVIDNKILFGLEAIKGIGEKFVDQLLLERENCLFKDFEDFKNRMKLSTSQIVTLVKSGAFPAKDKRQFLIKYAKSLFEIKEYKDVTTLPKLKDLQEKWDIDTGKIKDKEIRLKIYNQKRKVEYNKLQQDKYKKFTEEFTEKYLNNEKFWEFEALSIFINDNPFEKIYDYITPFEEIDDGTKGVIIGIVSNIVKKKDKHKKQFAYVSIYSTFGLIDIICWHSQFKEYQDLLKKGNKLALLCKKKDGKAICESIKTYEQWLIDKKLKYKQI